MAMALELQQLGVNNRQTWLYYALEGMTPPTSRGEKAGTGVTAAEMLDSTPVDDGNNAWCWAGIDDVRTNVMSTGYPASRFTFVQGDVSRTLLKSVPDSIALFPQDSDWYESTRSGLEILYPRLAVGGVCILDDHSHRQASRAAAVEYFEAQGYHP